MSENNGENKKDKTSGQVGVVDKVGKKGCRKGVNMI
jgi:hypothetical protein